jgi:hypothetical protein
VVLEDEGKMIEVIDRLHEMRLLMDDEYERIKKSVKEMGKVEYSRNHRSGSLYYRAIPPPLPSWYFLLKDLIREYVKDKSRMKICIEKLRILARR